MKEMGSEFWCDFVRDSDQSNVGDEIESKEFYTANLLSGRTALDFIIRDVRAKKKLTTVMMPSYCCESMIEPFIKNKIKVFFYSVREKEIKYDFSNTCDMVVVLDYFGFETDEVFQIAKKENKNGKLIVYDATHKLNGNARIEKYTDYSFCSYRKWSYCNYAEVKKFSDDFNIEVPQRTNLEYRELRDQAAILKARYMADDYIEKQLYLELFRQAEDILDIDYIDYAGEPIGLDIKSIYDKRRRNAQILIDGLASVQGLMLWYNHIGKTDVPLFVPVLLEQGKRDGLKKYLLERDVYCPVHWPLSKVHELKDSDKKIYDNELSLVCDQRYELEDIEREVRIVKNYFEG